MTSQKHPITKAFKAVGSGSELARRLGVHVSMPSQWAMGHRPIPAERCIEIERITNGAVRCEELRPDVDWAYLRATDCPACPVKEAA